MQVAGTIQRIEIKPETDEEKAHAQSLINLGRARHALEPLVYWGDSDTFNGALIINSHSGTGGDPAKVSTARASS